MCALHTAGPGSGRSAFGVLGLRRRRQPHCRTNAQGPMRLGPRASPTPGNGTAPARLGVPEPPSTLQVNFLKAASQKLEILAHLPLPEAPGPLARTIDLHNDFNGKAASAAVQALKEEESSIPHMRGGDTGKNSRKLSAHPTMQTPPHHPGPPPPLETMVSSTVPGILGLAERGEFQSACAAACGPLQW